MLGGFGVGVAPPILTSELIQWFKEGAVGATLYNPEDILDPLVTSSAEYLGIKRFIHLDGVGDALESLGTYTIDLADGVSFLIKLHTPDVGDPHIMHYFTSASGMRIQTKNTGTKLFLAIGDNLGNNAYITTSVIDMSAWSKITVIYRNGAIEILQNDNVIGSSTTAFGLMAIDRGILGRASGSATFCGMDICNLVHGGIANTLTSVVSGGSLCERPTTHPTYNLLVSSTTSGLVAMQESSSDAPALGCEYGGNLYAQWDSSNIVGLDSIPNQGQTDDVETIFEINVESPDVVPATRMFIGAQINRRLGLYADGTWYLGSSGAAPIAGDVRGTGYHTVHARMRNPSTGSERELIVDGVTVVNSVNDGTSIYPINADLQICIGDFKLSSLVPWQTATGARVFVSMQNFTNPLYLEWEYECLADGTWRNVETGQIFTPKNGAMQTYSSTKNLDTPTEDTNGMVLENEPAHLNSLGATVKQTDVLFTGGTVNVYAKDGLTFDEVTIDRYRRHAGLAGTNYNGAYGLWVKLDANNHIAYTKQHELANELTPAKVNALEVEFDCVGDSAAIRSLGDYVLDAEGYCTFIDYIMT